MYNELFESIIRTSGENTEDIDDFDDRDNFWAPTPENLLFERILREAHLQEMAELYRNKVVELIWGNLSFPTTNFKTKQEMRDHINKLNITSFINRCFKYAVDKTANLNDFIKFRDPAEQQAWLKELKNDLREKANQEGEYSRNYFIEIINRIDNENLLENGIAEALNYYNENRNN